MVAGGGTLPSEGLFLRGLIVVFVAVVVLEMGRDAIRERAFGVA